jgi:hypothetical protein
MLPRPGGQSVWFDGDDEGGLSERFRFDCACAAEIESNATACESRRNGRASHVKSPHYRRDFMCNVEWYPIVPAQKAACARNCEKSTPSTNFYSAADRLVRCTQAFALTRLYLRCGSDLAGAGSWRRSQVLY